MPFATASDAPSADASTTRGRATFLAFATLFCASGLLYSFTLGESLRFPDERDYIDLARHLAAFDGYSFDGLTPTAQRPPGYPAVIAPVVALADSVHAVRLLNFVALALGAHLLAGLLVAGREIPRWHRSSLMLAATFAYPVLYYTAGTLFPQIVIAFALTLLVALLARAKASVALAAGVGALAAFTVEISPTTLAIVPIALVLALWDRRWGPSRVLVMALAVALVFGGWLARNVIVVDEPILFSNNLAENLDNAVLTLEPLAPGEERAPKSTVDYALERLGQYLESPGIYVQRVVDFFAYRNEMTVSEESSRARDLVMFVTYHALLLAALLRMLLVRRLPLSPAERIALALYLGTALFHALVIPRIRYRIPFDFLLLLPAANALLFTLVAARERFLARRHLRDAAGTAARRTVR